MGRVGGLPRPARLTLSLTPMPSRYASLDGKEVKPSDSPLSSSLEDWCGRDRKRWYVSLSFQHQTLVKETLLRVKKICLID